MEKRNTNRTLVLFLIFVILMVLLTIRVYYIQIICHEELTEAAQSQYEVLVAGIDNRGQILDRNHMPLTGGLNQYYYFVEKDFADENLDFLMKSIDAEQIASTESSYLVYRAERYDKGVSDRAKDEYKAYVLECPTRYGEEQIACHLIGYLNEDEQKGVSGIELLCEEKLSKKQGALTLWADAAGYLISGTEPARSDTPKGKSTSLENEAGIVTTIDRRIQFATERFLQNQTTSGAAIVMDADTGEILAWTAMPTFNPNNIEDYLYSGSDCLINKVSQSAYPPGSVFKIVTALAGLEDGIDPALEFECEGKTEVEGIEVSCIVEEGHGKVDMREAMAVSCNCYFAKLCESVGYEKVIEDNNVPMFDDYTEIKAKVMKIKAEIDNAIDIKKVPCHNDALCENWVLGDGRMYLIDWEYAGMNDGLWDLADVSIEADYSEANDDLLLASYFGRTPTSVEKHRFIANKLYLDYLWTLWGKTRVPFDGQPMEEYALQRYIRLKKNIEIFEKN